jgi:uncharacterized protein YdbL (DUF1318 family)
MTKTIFLIIIFILFSLGCARIRVEAPKEPIKVDISMRLDIYQHIQKDIDAIEDIVSGSPKESQPSDKQSLLDYFIVPTYAQEVLSPEVEQAALRRKNRLAELSSWLQKGVVGENKSGLLEIKNTVTSDDYLKQLVKAENNDRMIIYESLAKKNNTSAEEIQKLYAQKLQEKALLGTPIEVFNASSGTYEWKIK